MNNHDVHYFYIFLYNVTCVLPKYLHFFLRKIFPLDNLSRRLYRISHVTNATPRCLRRSFSYPQGFQSFSVFQAGWVTWRIWAFVNLMECLAVFCVELTMKWSSGMVSKCKVLFKDRPSCVKQPGRQALDIGCWDWYLKGFGWQNMIYLCVCALFCPCIGLYWCDHCSHVWSVKNVCGTLKWLLRRMIYKEVIGNSRRNSSWWRLSEIKNFVIWHMQFVITHIISLKYAQA